MSQGMNTTNDSSYGQTAAGLGYVTEAQVQECVQVQAKMREMGIDEPLGEIMTKKGYISPQFHSNVLKKLGVNISPIPGYTILGKIGQGGMGAVYKAMQTSVNRTVAIKIMSATAVKDKTYVSRFFQEAQAAAALNHKNLIQAIDVGAAGGLYYFVMEFVTGKSCRELMNTKGGVFEEKKAVDVAMQMAEVLDHIHGHNMVHRDIKPENILLTADGTVKLCDLGLAKSTVPAEQSLTQDGLAVGTPYFMSPEQVRGDKDVDIRADLYSLGATLYFLVTGKHPYEGKSAAETMSLHLSAPIPDPRKSVPALREDLSWVIQKLMAKDRNERYQKPLDLLEDLKKIKTGSTPHLARQHAARAHVMHKAHVTARVNARKGAARWPFVVAGGGVAAAAAVVISLLMGNSNPEPRPAPEARPAKAPPPPVVVVKAPEAPKDDPKRAADAGRLYAMATEYYKGDKWSEAKAELEKLDKGFHDLQYTKDLSKSIGEMVGICDVRLKEQSSAQAKLFEQARSAMREGRWKEAHQQFTDLAKAGQAGLQKELERCRHEMDAETVLEETRAARSAANWVGAQVKLAELGQKYKDSQTLSRHKDEIVEIGVAVYKEVQAGQHLGQSRSAVSASKWPEATKGLSELEVYKETRTYRDAEPEIAKLRASRDAGLVKQGEEGARQAYSDAAAAYDRLINEKKYDDAQQAMRAFAHNHALTKFYEQKKPEADAKIADAGRKKASDRDAEARKIWLQLPKDMKAGNFGDAVEAIGRLLGDYADTPTVKSNEKAIKDNKAKCEQNMGVPENIQVLMEFEDYPGNWRTNGNCTAGNSDEPYQGKRAAHLLLPTGSNSRAAHPITGLTIGAESISFWARSVRKGPVALVDFTLLDDMYTFFVPVQLTTEWKLFSYRFNEFKAFTNNTGTTKNPPQLNRARVREFGFQATNDSQSGNGIVYEIQVDSLRVEGKK